jgi:hypothetical protein
MKNYFGSGFLVDNAECIPCSVRNPDQVIPEIEVIVSGISDDK